MGSNLSIAEVIHMMSEQSSKSSKQLADECGMNYSTFMRKISPVDEGSVINVDELLKYMAATKSGMILDHLNERSGRMYVPLPRGIRKGTNPKQDINTYSSKFMKVVSKLMLFLAEPSEQKREELLELIRIHQGDTENMRRRVRDDKLHQTEMELL